MGVLAGGGPHEAQRSGVLVGGGPHEAQRQPIEADSTGGTRRQPIQAGPARAIWCRRGGSHAATARPGAGVGADSDQNRRRQDVGRINGEEERREETDGGHTNPTSSDTMLGIYKLYYLGVKGHNI
jgi:hypothetical protein